MSSSKFTENQIELLRANPNVVSVSPSVVSLSKEFKEKIWEELCQGRDIHHILESNGLPCKILGETRIAGIKGLVKRIGNTDGNFRDAATLESRRNGFLSPQKRIEYLELQLKYKEQELDFLKKIVSLGQEESTQ